MSVKGREGGQRPQGGDFVGKSLVGWDEVRVEGEGVTRGGGAAWGLGGRHWQCGCGPPHCRTRHPPLPNPTQPPCPPMLRLLLQLACLEADMAILDEIDSGLDIDALRWALVGGGAPCVWQRLIPTAAAAAAAGGCRDVSHAVNGLKAGRAAMGVLMVTHYRRLLDYIKPDRVHVMQV